MGRNAEGNTKTKKTKRDQGFSLVELLVAIAVLSIVVVPTLKVFVASTKTTSKSRTELQANITAQSVMESANAFSIYVYNTQCNTTYNDGNANSFNLLAGTSSHSFVSSAYGGTVGTVTFDTDGKTIKSVGKTDGSFQETAEQYAFAINGIQQSGNKYDAIIVFEKDTDENMKSVSDGTATGTLISADSARSIADSGNAVYNLKYKIKVYVFKHETDALYLNKDITNNSDCLVTVEGSKLDAAKVKQ